ncbi:MAG TPA: redoxin domain-containing protein [Methanomassiliicoccales archaeon]|nr:redoxin domain-containing protein [Methanomassiliicoccales archaeon]
MDLERMPGIGQKAPDFQLPDDPGNVIRLGDLCQRGVVLLMPYPADLGIICKYRWVSCGTFTTSSFRRAWSFCPWIPTASAPTLPGRNRCACRSRCWRTRKGRSPGNGTWPVTTTPG